VVIAAWRDIASTQAGGSTLLVDQLAAGLTARGDRVTPLCGGPRLWERARPVVGLRDAADHDEAGLSMASILLVQARPR
jgi:hypothetical protein